MDIRQLNFKENLIVLGNQSADLDSTVSAFSLAALIAIVNPSIKVYPLIQGSPSDLRLKPEIKALFTHAGIALNPQYFLTEGLQNGYNADSIILVDHNKPDVLLPHHRIAGIVDHHEDLGEYPNLPLREIKRTGSCSTLISRYWKEAEKPLPYAQRVILSAAMAVDTGYLNPQWGKTTQMDREEYTRLTERLQEKDKHFIESLITMKNDLSQLNMEDHLRRDFKFFPLIKGRGGISSIPLIQQKVFSEGFYNHNSVTEFCKENDLKFLLIMHTMDQPFRRELSLYVPPGSEEDGIRDQLEHALEALDQAGIRKSGPLVFQKWQCFSQEDPSMSRKVIVPLLRKELTYRQGPIHC